MSATKGGRVLAFAALALAMSAAGAHAAPDCRKIPVYRAGCFGGGPGCHAIPYAEQPCFVVRGQLSAWNGAPTFRLHPSGSKRLLGVLGGDGDAASATVLTPDLRAAMTPAEPGDLRPVTGVFRVCPLTTERAGWMRAVCIADARQITPSPDAR